MKFKTVFLAVLFLSLSVSHAEAEKRIRKNRKLPKNHETMTICGEQKSLLLEFQNAFLGKYNRGLEKQNFVIDYWGLERIRDKKDNR